MSTIPDSRLLRPVPGPAATLLVFTLGAEAQGRRKRLLPDRLRAPETALYRACLEEALAAGRAAGCRLEVSSPRPLALAQDATAVAQEGRGFGPRFAHAFDGALRRARSRAGSSGSWDRFPARSTGTAAPVVAVGTDTPGLDTRHVARALSLLASGRSRTTPGGAPRPRAVLGPSPDGGFYLLAADRPLGAILRRVRWCRRTTCGHLRRLLTAAGFEVELLEPLADLDRRPDLERWLADPGTAGRRRPALTRDPAAAIARMLASLRRPATPRSSGRPRPGLLPLRRERGPPLSP